MGYLVGKTPDSVGLLSRIERFNKKMIQNPQSILPSFNLNKEETKSKPISLDKSAFKHPDSYKESPMKAISAGLAASQLDRGDMSPLKNTSIDKVKHRSVVN